MTTVAAAKPKVYQLRDFTLHVYGYTGDCFTLTELPGWPQSLKAVSPAEIGNHGDNESILIWFTNDERQFTLEEACEALSVLQKHNLGYHAIMAPVVHSIKGDKSLRAWPTSPSGRPQVLAWGTREAVTLIRSLLEAEAVENYPADFPRRKAAQEELHNAFIHNIKAAQEAQQLIGLNEMLGG